MPPETAILNLANLKFSSFLSNSKYKDGIYINLMKSKKIIIGSRGSKLALIYAEKAKEKNLDINEYYFRYKGPIPQSKETAILMLADGCEAALRAMNINASDKEALKTISNIIYSRQKDGQLDDSNLSKGEIYLIKGAFLNVWKRIRHRRIQYPTSKNNTFS